MSPMLRVHDPFRRGQLATAALFFSLGFQYATWASRLPAIKSHLDLTAAEVGLLLMATGIGAVATFPVVAVLMRRLGSRRLALASALGLALLLPAMSALPDYPVALLVMLCDGALVGGLNVAMNAQGAALEAVHERNAMARLHAVFSGGSLAAALLASGMNALTSTLIVHFAVAAGLILLLLGFARGGLLTEDRQSQEKKEKGRGRWTLPSRVTLWLGAAMVFGTVTEGAMNDWSALYMKDVAKASAELAPMGIAVVSVMMVLARVFADSWRSRWGDGRIVRVGSALAAVGLALALLSGEWCLRCSASPASAWASPRSRRASTWPPRRTVPTRSPSWPPWGRPVCSPGRRWSGSSRTRAGWSGRSGRWPPPRCSSPCAAPGFAGPRSSRKPLSPPR